MTLSLDSAVLALLLPGLLLGFLFNATPGAVFAETLRRGLRGGFRPAFDVQLGSLVGDATWAVLGLTAAGALLAIPAVRVPLALAGSAYLLWLGVCGLRDAFAASGQDASASAADPSPPVQRAGAVRAGVLLSLTNPQNIGFWAAVGAVVPALGGPEPAATDLAWFFAGFMASSILWCGICAGLVAWMKHALPDLVLRGIHLTCGLFLLVLAAMQLWRLVHDPRPARQAAAAQPFINAVSIKEVRP
jgi:chemosensory pili system protein ChpE